MRTLLFCAAAAVLLPAAHADTFILTSSGNTLVFYTPASPTPASSNGSFQGFSLDPVNVTTNGTAAQQSVSFYAGGSNGGGMSIQGAGQGAKYDGGSGLVVDQSGSPLFSGTLSQPTFLPGTYSLSNLGGTSPTYSENFALTVLAADVDVFLLKGGNTNLVFYAPPSPTPTSTSTNIQAFSLDPVSVTTNGTAAQQSVSFYAGGFGGGGLSIQGAGQGAKYDNGAGLLIDEGGIPLFSGTLSQPTFLPGTYNLTTSLSTSPTYSQNFALTIVAPPTSSVTPAVTPEPSSLVLLGTGLLGAVGMVRRKVRAATA